ncbi:DEAD/DEAH box helicase [bacterium]|nr:MAG: DEAD/DEAH box helicase [bacterium]
MSYGLFGEEDLVRAGEVPSIVLRDYQQKALAAVLAAKDRGLQRVMVVMATGCGKTTVFASLVDQFERSYASPSLVLAHRHELLTQAANRIASFSPRLQVGIEGGDRNAPYECQVVVAGVQSVGRPDTKRLDWFHPGLMIIDEGHHAPADSYQIAMRRFGSYDGSCFTLAVTATDHRMDNKPLHGATGAIFEDVVFRFGLRDAVREGWLVDLRGFRVATDVDLSGIKSVGGDYNQGQLARAVNTQERNYTAYRHWREVAGDRRTIVFCVDVQHAKDFTELLKSHHVAAEHVDGTMKMDKREGILRRFNSGKTQVLVNVDVATEGFDAPATDCVLLLRPTQSWSLYAQMVGRGLRTLGGVVDGQESAQTRKRAIAESAKGDCIVIDVVDASKEFGLAAPPEKDPDAEPEKPKGATASLAGLVGLPPEFDLQGNSLFAAAERVEELEPARKGALFRRQTNWEDLSTVLSEVDLIKELSIPEEIVGVSGLAWMKVGDGEYWLPCGDSSLEKNRAASITTDELGRMTVELKSSMMPPMQVPLGDDLQRAFDEADKLIRMTWSDAGRIVKADARWRERPPSERQKEILKSLGVEDREIALLETMHQARSLIERRRIGLRARVR